MDVPSWWPFLLLAFGTFRIWRLLADDKILEKPRRWLVRLGPDWREEGDPVPENYREYLAVFLMCPWCLGFWLSLAIWGAWQVWPHITEVAMVPFALNAAMALVRGNLDEPEE